MTLSQNKQNRTYHQIASNRSSLVWLMLPSTLQKEQERDSHEGEISRAELKSQLFKNIPPQHLVLMVLQLPGSGNSGLT